MTHLNIFLMILSLVLGVAAVTRIIRAYLQYKYSYLLALGVYLGWLNVTVLLSLIKNYVFANVMARFASKTAVLVETGYRALQMISQWILFYIFIYILAQLLMVRLSPAVKRVYLGFAIVVTMWVVALASWSVIEINVTPILTAYIIFMYCGDGAGAALAVMFFLRLKNLEEKSKRKALMLFGLFYIVPFVIMGALSLLHVFGNVSNNILLLISSFFLYIIYTAMIFLLKRFMILYHGKLELAGKTNGHLEDLYEKYNISKREREVVTLIREGKSNKEIEDELYISIQTVKDHIYNIYRKTGVKNRVQLSRLFEAPPG
jgi:DNA-binding CsgD family transcriptional regulator